MITFYPNQNRCALTDKLYLSCVLFFSNKINALLRNLCFFLIFFDLIIEIPQDKNIINKTIHTQDKDLYNKLNKASVYVNTRLKNMSHHYLFCRAFIITSFLRGEYRFIKAINIYYDTCISIVACSLNSMNAIRRFEEYVYIE